MKYKRKAIINEISYLESTYCMNCPLLNENINKKEKVDAESKEIIYNV